MTEKTEKGGEGKNAPDVKRGCASAALWAFSLWAAIDSAGGVINGLGLLFAADVAWAAVLYIATGAYKSELTVKEKADMATAADRMLFPLKHAFFLASFLLVRALVSL